MLVFVIVGRVFTSLIGMFFVVVCFVNVSVWSRYNRYRRYSLNLMGVFFEDLLDFSG